MNDSLDEALGFLMARFNDALVGAGISVSAGIDWNIVASLFVMGFAFVKVGLILLEHFCWFTKICFRRLLSHRKQILAPFMFMPHMIVIASGYASVIYIIVMSFSWVFLHIKQYTFQFLLIGGVICAAEWAIPKLMDILFESVILESIEEREGASC